MSSGRGPWSRLRTEAGWHRQGPSPQFPRPPRPPRPPATGKLLRRLRHAAVWFALAGILAIGYSYRFELTDLVNRLGGEIVPYAAVTTEDGAVRVRAHRDGHFYIDSRVNGADVRFLIDTGATIVALSPDDAERIGFDPSQLTFSQRLHTAGGIVRAAPVVIRSLELGDIRLSNVRAVVNGERLPHSLLGISALERLSGYEVRDGTLTLRP